MTQALVISIDAMGGDHGPSVVIPAVAKALGSAPPAVRYLLHGDEAQMAPLLAKCRIDPARIEVSHTDKVVAMDEKPAQAMRRGKGTSMWNAVEAIRSGQAAVALSAGNTGALMAMSKLILRMAPGIERPALGAVLPTARGPITFLDVGADLDSDAERLVENAIMGEAYHRAAHGIPRPTVGLLNVGSEDMKGHEEVREAHAVLREGRFDLDYRGFVEGDDITAGAVDVVVTDGFTGNVALKAMEGAARFMQSGLKSALTDNGLAMAGALLASGALRKFSERMNPPPVAPFLGLNGLVLKTHGGVKEAGFAQVLQVAADLAQSDFAAEIERNLRKLPAALAEAAPVSADGAASSV